ncbi:TolC family protein [Desulfuribacillus alkaliarsenatis]|uniref:Uncharacterized protein n=1 Tax=Desulfuribacillus alkaliarsenatis TaxID=766136 RepID=A0A1E5G2C2_9FIRM|nr:TolC family protein [Desulfuribacillus alkaliarsenatis]OEF97125.1 hypothetical protein BHF68_05885 [Desulfuribacillus alkaliarsenatis]
MIGNSHKTKKTLIITLKWLIILSLVISLVSPTIVMANRTTHQLSMEETIHHTTRNNSGLRDTRINRIKKTIERREAIEAVRIAQRRERFPWFTLLMSINLPQKNTLPRAIELLMKLPEINSELHMLRHKEQYETIVSKHDAQLAYYDVLLAQYTVNRTWDYIYETQEALERLRRQQRIGLADIRDVEYLEGALEGHQTTLKKAIQDLEKSIDKINKLTQLRTTVNTTFPDYVPSVNLDRSQLDDIIDHAIKYDYSLLEATQERKIAQARVVELIDLYNNRWGSTVRPMTQYVQSQIGRQAERLDRRINYDVFINSYYEPALNRIEAPWSGSFRFRILFITIRIPKEWFKLGTVAERYFDDEKYALFNALVERDQAIDMENDIRENLIQQVKDTYFTLKQMEAVNEDAIRNLARAERNYEISLRDNKLGLVTFQELHSEKMNFYEQQDGSYEALLEYGKTIAMFNMFSSGYLDVLSGDFQATSLADGDSWISESGEIASWYIETLLTDYKFTFGVQVPDTLGVTDYELYTANHVQIGDRTVVSETISHLPLSLEESSMLYVKFYKDDELRYIAQLDGFGVTGPLLLQEATEDTLPEAIDIAIGTWQVSMENQYRAIFEMGIHQDIVWDEYSLHYGDRDGIQIGSERTNAGAPIGHLPSTFSEPEKLKVRLYSNGSFVTELGLQVVENNAGILVELSE